MFEKVFTNRDGVDFSACWEAERWCAVRGISVGSMERGAPRGLLFDDVAIAKWRNLTASEKEALDGQMIAGAGSFRGGPIAVRLFKVDAEPEVTNPEEDEDFSGIEPSQEDIDRGKQPCPRPCSECDRATHHRLPTSDRCKHCDAVLPDEEDEDSEEAKS